MTTYQEELAKSGIATRRVGAATILEGVARQIHGSKPHGHRWPFTEAKELIAGYTIIQVKSREEALEWSKRFPNPVGEGAKAEIEVRQLYELEDLGPSDAIEHFRELLARGK